MQINETQCFLSDKQLAIRYGVHRTTIWRWVRTGNFPAPKILSSKCSRWADDDIAAHEHLMQQEAR